MAQDWLADVRTYDANADEGVVAAIVRYCGIALRSENASQVTFSEQEETDRVRDNFLKKKLGLTDDDATLDAAIQSVGAGMGGGTRNRVSVYYLLTKHFGMFSIFGGVAAAAAAAATPTPEPIQPAVASTASAPAAKSTSSDEGDDGIWGIAALAGAVMFGAIIVSAIIGVWVKNTALTADPVEEEVAVVETVTEVVEVTEPAAPDGAGVTAATRDGKPMVSVYFDSGSAAVAPDFNTAVAEVLAFLEANPDASVAISGFNDPSGDAARNAELSKNRAQAVQAALVAAGLAEERTDLVKPDDATTTDMTAAEARRVEIVIVE